MILKKKRIIQITISKSPDWYRDESVEILEPTKIPLVRLPSACGRKCAFSAICSFSRYTISGLRKFLKIKNYYNYIYISFCNCIHNTDNEYGGKFGYIFTYEIIRKYIPIEVLEEMGLYKAPKAKKKQIIPTSSNNRYQLCNKQYNNKVNSSFRNYNARRK